MNGQEHRVQNQVINTVTQWLYGKAQARRLCCKHGLIHFRCYFKRPHVIHIMLHIASLSAMHNGSTPQKCYI